MCNWTDRLPGESRHDADEILGTAARDGVDLADLARLAQEMYERSRREASGDDDDGFGDRAVWLGATLGGAGRLDGDLTPGCTAALTAVLAALSKKAGPDDTRTTPQRRHDALEEACRRLIAAGLLPAQAGQPTQAQVHLTLSQLRGLPGASAAESAWLSQPEAAATACDATLAPVVSGHLDPAALDQLVEVLLAARGLRPDGSCGCTCGGCTCGGRNPLPADTLARVRVTLLRLAADTLSGPGGLAAWLRRSLLDGEVAAPSLPLDIPLDTGQATHVIPAHLRRAVTIRHTHCAFPGCAEPTSVCQVHHLVPRSLGGPASLGNLVPLCSFHHLTAVHRWGWSLRLNPDATTTAISPDGSRVLRSHGPPGQAA